MNCLEAMFYENYLTSDFHTNTVISSCLPTRQNGVENRDKAYARPFSLLEPIDERHLVFNLQRALKLGSHEKLVLKLSGAAARPVLASTTSFRPSPVSSPLTPPSLLDGMKDKVASLNTCTAKTRLNFGSIIEKN